MTNARSFVCEVADCTAIITLHRSADNPAIETEAGRALAIASATEKGWAVEYRGAGNGTCAWCPRHAQAGAQ